MDLESVSSLSSWHTLSGYRTVYEGDSSEDEGISEDRPSLLHPRAYEYMGGDYWMHSRVGFCFFRCLPFLEPRLSDEQNYRGIVQLRDVGLEFLFLFGDRDRGIYIAKKLKKAFSDSVDVREDFQARLIRHLYQGFVAFKSSQAVFELLIVLGFTHSRILQLIHEAITEGWLSEDSQMCRNLRRYLEEMPSGLIELMEHQQKIFERIRECVV